MALGVRPLTFLRGCAFGDKGQVWGQVSAWALSFPGAEGQAAGEAKTGERQTRGRKAVNWPDSSWDFCLSLAPDRGSQSDSDPVNMLGIGGLTPWVPE